jgi:hypothetical protein
MVLSVEVRQDMVIEAAKALFAKGLITIDEFRRVVREARG